MKKKVILGTSDAWSMSRLSQRSCDPAYYIEDCLIFVLCTGNLSLSSVYPDVKINWALSEELRVNWDAPNYFFLIEIHLIPSVYFLAIFINQDFHGKNAPEICRFLSILVVVPLSWVLFWRGAAAKTQYILGQWSLSATVFCLTKVDKLVYKLFGQSNVHYEVQWVVLLTLQVKSGSGILRPFSKAAEKTCSCFSLDTEQQ